ncbi:MAG: DUF1028 domain-containing protein [Alphaproteobacteria bacterium]|jgi:uncharacterized Ntn-hydrolase superfamily protein|nr:DUF1028 domain-containing protein [Alphaproteobacteria bacterium]
MLRPLNTFSIVAREPETGHLGIAVSTKVPAVGAICPFVRFGVGAVTTQAWVNPYLGPRILDRLEAGETATSALNHEIAADPDRAIRQVGVVDAAGRAAAYSGAETDPWAGQQTGSDYSVQGNMLVGADTVKAMADTFIGTAGTPLAERLLLALEAGQAAGGDKRGRQSAALIVRGPEVYPVADLRVDEHADPVAELRRIFLIAQKELFPFIAAMPTRDNPQGNFAAVRSAMAPKD